MKKNNGKNGKPRYSIGGGTALSLLAIVAVAVMLVAVIMPSTALNDPVPMDITVNLSDGLDQNEFDALKGDSDPVWEGATNTLHIYGTNFESTCAVAIYSQNALTIDVNGTCRIVSHNTNNSQDYSHGIWVDNKLTITGSGSVFVKSGNVNIESQEQSLSAGINSSKLTITGKVTVEVESGDVGVLESNALSFGIKTTSLTIDNSDVTTRAGNATGPYLTYSIGIYVVDRGKWNPGSISIKDSTVDTYGGDANSTENIPGSEWVSISAGLMFKTNGADTMMTVDNSTINAYGDDATVKGDGRAFSAGIISYKDSLFKNSDILCKSGKCDGANVYPCGLICQDIRTVEEMEMNGGFVILSNSKLVANGGEGVNATKKAFSCGFFANTTNDLVIKDNSTVHVKSGNITNAGFRTNVYISGINVNNMQIMSSSYLESVNEDCKIDSEINYCDYTSILCKEGAGITDSTVNVICGNITCVSPCNESVACGLKTLSKEIIITNSTVSIALGNNVSISNSTSKGMVAEDASLIYINEGSTVTVNLGNTIAGPEGKAQSIGIENLIKIEKATLVSHSGNVSPDAERCNSTGIAIVVYEGSEYASITSSTLFGSAGTIESNGLEGKYYGITYSGKEGGLEIKDSSVCGEGLTGSFNGAFLASSTTGEVLMIGSKTVENPVYEIVEGPITEEIAAQYKILRVVLEDEINDVTYDLNGGIGPVPETETHIALLTFIVKPCEATKDGYKFAGWTDGVNVYQPGDEVVMPYGSVTLTAVWEEVPGPGPGPEPEPEHPSEGMSVPLLVLLCVTVVALILIGTYRDDRKNE